MNIDSVIHNYLLSKESKEELRLLESWKEESKSNLEVLQALENNWNLLDEMKDYRAFDTPKAWEELSSNMVEEKEPKVEGEIKARKETKVFPLWKYAIAASVTLLVGLFVWNSVPNNGVGTASEPVGILTSVNDIMTKDLEDGSSVWLNKSSALDISKFSKSNRSIALQAGEAFFQVESDKENPFSVDVSDFQITVVGTAFNVKKADQEVEIYVHEGVVSVSNGKRTVQLRAGDMITGNVDNFALFDKDNDNLVSWKSKKLVFKNTFLPEALKDISRHYGKSVELSPGAATENCFISTEFRSETLEEVIEELKVLFQIKVSENEERIIITEINC